MPAVEAMLRLPVEAGVTMLVKGVTMLVPMVLM